MLDFCKKNPLCFASHQFEYAALFAMFKLAGGLMCLFANLMVMLRSGSVEDTVKDFIAIEIISTVDDMMAGTVKGDGTSTPKNLLLKKERNNMWDGDLIDWFVFDKPPKLPEEKEKKTANAEAEPDNNDSPSRISQSEEKPEPE